MKIGITFDLRAEYLSWGFSQEATAEFEAVETIDAIEHALTQMGAQTIRIGHIKNLVSRLAKEEQFDLIFNIAEGMYGFGREAQIPALLDAYQIPYTFSDPLTLSLSLHKGMAKRVLSDFKIQTAPFVVAESIQDLENVSLEYPLFAKPIAQGTSKGIGSSSKIENMDALYATCKKLMAEYREPVLIEKYLPGREFTVGIWGTGSSARPIGVMEIIFTEKSGQFYGYENKQSWTYAPQTVLAKGEVADVVSGIALNAYKALGCRDAGRVDVRLDALGVPYVLEINPLAGLRPHYCDLPILCDLAGVSYQSLIEKIVSSALERKTRLL